MTSSRALKTHGPAREQQSRRHFMRWKRLLAASTLVVMGGAAMLAQSSGMTKKEQANVKFVENWWREVLMARHLELAPKYQAENYIQHNINVPTGREGFVKFFSALP